MDKVLDKITFQFLIGQLLSGSVVVLVGIAIHHAYGTVSTGSRSVVAALAESYVRAVAELNDTSSILTFIAGATIVALILQGILNLTIANLESFRTRELTESGEWIPRSDVRARSRLRRLVAQLWKDGKTAVIIPLAPLVLAFDLCSVAAASPSDLYKNIYVIRSRTLKASELAAALADYEYLAAYFSNMAVALLIGLCLHVIFVPGLLQSSFGWLSLAAGYLLVGSHYFQGRITRTSIDHEVYKTFGGDEDAAA